MPGFAAGHLADFVLIVKAGTVVVKAFSCHNQDNPVTVHPVNSDSTCLLMEAEISASIEKSTGLC